MTRVTIHHFKPGGRCALYGDVFLRWAEMTVSHKDNEQPHASMICLATDRRDGQPAFSIIGSLVPGGVSYSYQYLHCAQPSQIEPLPDIIDQVHAELCAMTRYKEAEGRGLAW